MLALYAITLFVSATLLFWVQPMFTKMALPLLGGSPAVWTTAMMFFQAALLAGYAYTHMTTRWIGLKGQSVLHLALLLVAFLTLPIVVRAGSGPPPEGNPVPWLVTTLILSVGLPFLAIAANAPMLQKWFAHTRHPAADNPYFLYAISNLGRVLALLAYPVAVEPLLRLTEQSWVWSGSYGLLGLLTLGCAGLMWTRYAPQGAEALAESAGGWARAAPEPAPSRRVATGDRLWWLVLAFAPSILLLGVTTYLTTDIAAVPLLWVVPLTLYLLTFVVVFSRRPAIRHGLAVRLQPFLLLPLVIVIFWGVKGGVAVLYPMHLVAFFFTALVCHGELAARRPSPDHLTEFYLWMSAGGLLGGLFNAVVAPLIFESIVEYPLAIALAAGLRPYLVRAEAHGPSWRDLAFPALLFLLIFAVIQATGEKPSQLGLSGLLVVSCLVGLGLYAFRARPLRFGLGIGAVLLASTIWGQGEGIILDQERNFFGVMRVVRLPDNPYHLLYHGTTLHGAQSTETERRREPLTYYTRSGPLGAAIEGLGDRLAGARVAAVGLGAGSVACYSRPGQEWTFYEIDPAVARVARDPDYFTFLSDCAPDARVVMGDARLRLGEAPEGYYRLIILDAFSSAAVPMHLLTRQALELYMTRLEDDGVLAFHTTNKHLDLAPVLGNLVRELRLSGRFRVDKELSAEDVEGLKRASSWALIARREAALGPLADDPRWAPLPVDQRARVWTDDFSNIVGSLNF
ncbi:MAG: fused MFS/spermidine synthase [Alphaproteobacteria bacterium]|nr:fused MFS/spermidine synthase [Alphaproteobacteria bacterium]